MSQDRHQRISELFEQVRELPKDERRRALEEACRDDPSLVAEVESLITAELFDTTGLRQQIGETAAETMALEPEVESIGEYRILRSLGEGGMGAVYEAQQEEPRRSVALKVIRSGAMSESLLARFRHEAQILGQLRHSGIAQIYAAGRTPESEGSRPYFAMELVRGVPVTEFVKTNKLDTRERLELVAKICDAVQHAHHKGVIHRDLKPANILVESGGQPKVLDFGVARATDGDRYALTVETQIGQIVGTLAYMSPEQASGDPSELDLRSDIYALGVLLHELLTGELPYDVKNKPIDDAISMIRHQDPKALGLVDTQFRGDIETIVAKALNKEKDRRYASAAELASDIRRHLRDEPITARPASVVYQLRKFGRRHRIAVTAIVAVLIALVGGVVGTSVMAAKATRAEAEAKREADIALAINEFLNLDLLSASDPGRDERDLTIREVLDIASEKIEDRFPDQPLVEAGVRHTLGRTYNRLGQSKAALDHVKRAYELRKEGLGPGHVDTTESMLAYIVGLLEQGNYDEAIELAIKGVELLNRERDPDDAQRLMALGNLSSGYLQTGQYDKAAPILQESLESKRRTFGELHAHTLTSLHNLAGLKASLGDLEAAEQDYRDAYEGRREVLGEGDPQTVSAMKNFGWLLGEREKHDEAEELLKGAIRLSEQYLDRSHWVLPDSMRNLAGLYLDTGRLDEAQALFEQIYANELEHRGPDQRIALSAKLGLADVFAARPSAPEAVEARWVETYCGIEGLTSYDGPFARRALDRLIEHCSEHCPDRSEELSGFKERGERPPLCPVS